MFTLLPATVWLVLLIVAAFGAIAAYFVTGESWHGRNGRDWSLIVIGACLSAAFLVMFLGTLVADLFEAIREAVPDQTPAPVQPAPEVGG